MYARNNVMTPYSYCIQNGVSAVDVLYDTP